MLLAISAIAVAIVPPSTLSLASGVSSTSLSVPVYSLATNGSVDHWQYKDLAAVPAEYRIMQVGIYRERPS